MKTTPTFLLNTPPSLDRQSALVCAVAIEMRFVTNRPCTLTLTLHHVRLINNLLPIVRMCIYLFTVVRMCNYLSPGCHLGKSSFGKGRSRIGEL